MAPLAAIAGAKRSQKAMAKFSVDGIMPFRKGDVLVEVSVIYMFNHLALHNVFQVHQIHDKAGIRVYRSLNRDNELKVVAMAVAVGTFSKDRLVLVLRPSGIVQAVGGAERLLR